MTTRTLELEIQALLGAMPQRISPLSGGCVGEVYRVEFGGESGATRDDVVAKVNRSETPNLSIEAYMLRYLRENSLLPVPEVLHASDRLLLMTFAPGQSRFSPAAETHAAELLADLHRVRANRFGLERDTLIGGLPQSNAQSESWLSFFARERLFSWPRPHTGRGGCPCPC